MTQTLRMTACALAAALAAGVAQAQCPHDTPRPTTTARPAPQASVPFFQHYFGHRAPAAEAPCTATGAYGVAATAAPGDSDFAACAAAEHMLHLCRCLCSEGKYRQAAAVARAVAAVQPENVCALTLVRLCEVRMATEGRCRDAAEACEPAHHNRAYEAKLRARHARAEQAAQAESCKCHKDGKAACVCKDVCKCMPAAGESRPARRVAVGFAVPPGLPLPVPAFQAMSPFGVPCPAACCPCPQVRVNLPLVGSCPVQCPPQVAVNSCGVACPPAVNGGCCASAPACAPCAPAAPQGAVRVSANGGRLRISSAGVEVECDRMVQHGTNGKVMLEGNVTVEFRREGRPAAVVADRIAVHMNECTYEVNPHPVQAMPVKPIKAIRYHMVVPAPVQHRP